MADSFNAAKAAIGMSDDNLPETKIQSEQLIASATMGVSDTKNFNKIVSSGGITASTNDQSNMSNISSMNLD